MNVFPQKFRPLNSHDTSIRIFHRFPTPSSETAVTRIPEQPFHSLMMFELTIDEPQRHALIDYQPSLQLA